MVLFWRSTTNHLHPWMRTWPLSFFCLYPTLSLINAKTTFKSCCQLAHHDCHWRATWLLIKQFSEANFVWRRILSLNCTVILTLPTSTGSGPVYSSMTKNWFQTHPRLDLWSTWPSFPTFCLCLCSDKWPTNTKTPVYIYLYIYI